MIRSRRLLARIGGRAGFLRDSSGGAAAEMALVLPGLAFIALNVTDLSVYIYSKMQVDLAAQEAAGAARVECDGSTAAKGLPATTSCTNLGAAMNAAVQATSLGANVSVSATDEKYYCSDSTGAFQPAEGYAIGSAPTDCSGTITGSTAAPGDYIKVTVSYPFSSVFPGASVAALMPANIQRTAWMRLK